MSEWISVKNRLPEDGQEVIVAGEQWAPVKKLEHYVTVAKYNKGGLLHSFSRNGFLLQRVHHWMPLPDPPKEKP